MIASDLLMDKVERTDNVDDPYRKEVETFEMGATDLEKNEYNPITGSHWLPIVLKIARLIKLH